MRIILSVFIVLAAGLALAQNGDNIATLRGAAIADQPTPPRMAPVENNDVRRQRAYPMQPPTIPHKIDGYQVDLRVNRCMTCHSRKLTEASQAPMISVTHYMDRDGNFLADVSPRRYFCEQCHVVQTDAPALVDNGFQDIDHLLRAAQ